MPDAPTKIATGFVRTRKKRKRRFKTNQVVDNSTYNRTLNRISALDKIPADLEKNSKITGSDARRVKRLLRKQRARKTTYSI